MYTGIFSAKKIRSAPSGDRITSKILSVRSILWILLGDVAGDSPEITGRLAVTASTVAANGNRTTNQREYAREGGMISSLSLF